jgi:hypothetical protein
MEEAARQFGDGLFTIGFAALLFLAGMLIADIWDRRRK